MNGYKSYVFGALISSGILSMHATANTKFVYISMQEPRDYYAKVSEEELEDIKYVINMLGFDSLLKVAKHKSSLKRAGDRIDHIHPLKFLTAIFSDEQMKVALHNMRGRGWIWKEFIGGVKSTLSEEKQKGNLPPEIVQNFAKKLGIEVDIILSSIEKEHWNDLIDLLIEHLPRKGNPNRYNM